MILFQTSVNQIRCSPHSFVSPCHRRCRRNQHISGIDGKQPKAASTSKLTATMARSSPAVLSLRSAPLAIPPHWRPVNSFMTTFETHHIESQYQRTCLLKTKKRTGLNPLFIAFLFPSSNTCAREIKRNDRALKKNT